jgi:hypothetical protein
VRAPWCVEIALTSRLDASGDVDESGAGADADDDEPVDDALDTDDSKKLAVDAGDEPRFVSMVSALIVCASN